MADSWYLWVSSIVWVCSVVSAHPCNIDQQGSATCYGKSLHQVPSSLPRHITSLDLSFNSLTMPKHGTFLRNFPSLRFLNLSSNIIPTLYPAVFCNLKTLHLLDLSNCSISVIHPKSFVGLQNLQTLLLKNNKLQSLDPSMFPIPWTLFQLDLRNNELSSGGELIPPLVKRINHVKLQETDWMYNGSITPVRQGLQQREVKQILYESHPEPKTEEITIPSYHDIVQRRKYRIRRDEHINNTIPSTNNTSMPPPGKVANSWPYFAGFVLLAVGISIGIALIAKCKLLQRNRASYHHQRLPDSHSVGSSRTEDVPGWEEADMDVAYGRNQPVPGVAGCHAEDDDGFIEDNYIEPSHEMKKEEEEEEMEPHFKL
ncbi:type III endosome membrane protein TEMP [Heteronotia binoei]|uniref:type III endosome membrane protein TEMP n=1 Tax=Heteronotia binoei TaxID=13085 RepID=UPI00292FF8AA|nr:type III endosome membrane protein TEMP [Heteronotia binoei]XP_060087611.1 type III endosome membrane protein TEMP [Heteronotia binoei]XP_060087612.1 type III endosome membrane protein TEMP [Heteronotia binoei]